MPKRENWDGRLKSLLVAQLSLHTQCPNLHLLSLNLKDKENIKYLLDELSIKPTVFFVHFINPAILCFSVKVLLFWFV